MQFTSYKANSLFTSTFDGRTRRRFDNAFQPKPNSHREADRTWVKGVMRLCADGFGVTYSQFVHAFKSGSEYGLRQRMQKNDTEIQKRIRELNYKITTFDREMVPAELMAERAKLRDHGSYGTLDQPTNNFLDSVRKVMNFALDSRHPNDPLPPMGKSDDTNEAAIAKAMKQFKRAVRREGVEFEAQAPQVAAE